MKWQLNIEAGAAEPTTMMALPAMHALGYVALEQRAENRKNVRGDAVGTPMRPPSAGRQ